MIVARRLFVVIIITIVIKATICKVVMPVLAVDGSCYDVSDSEQRYGCTNGNISCEDSGLFTATVRSSSKVIEVGK